MKSIVNKVREKLPTQKPGLLGLVGQILKRQEFDLRNPQDLEELILLLKKSSHERTASDIDRIRVAFFKSKFFNDLETQMGPEIVNNLYKQLQHESISEREPVFHFGDIGRKFYVILSGTVWILVKKKGLSDGNVLTEAEKKEEQKQQRKNTKRLTKHLSIKKTSSQFLTQPQGIPSELDNHLKGLPEAKFLETMYPSFQKVGEMSVGQSFGEIALSKQVPRTATIICSVDCNFATVTREQFNLLLKTYYEYIQQLNVNFLQKIFVFQNWNEQMLNQLYYHFTFQDIFLFHNVYKEGEESKFIYLIKNGEIEISQQVEIGTNALSSDLTQMKFFSPQTRKYRRVRLSLLSAGAVFGHQEILSGTNRTTQASCVSQTASLFVLDKARFLQYFSRNEALDFLKQQEKKTSEINNVHVDTIKEMTHQQPILEERDIPYMEPPDMLRDFVIKKPTPSVQRVGSEKKHSAYELLQGKGHVSRAHYNFNRYEQIIRKNIKDSAPLLVENAIFEFDTNKGSAISIMNKCFPAATRQKYVIPDCTLTTNFIIKALKLPKLLTESEAMRSHPNLHHTSFTNFTYKTPERSLYPDKEQKDNKDYMSFV